MFYGVLAASGVVLLTDADHGKPVVECAGPSGVPDGYREDWVWVDTGDQLLHVCDVVPVEGTPEQAALALSRMQFQSIPDEYAYELRALADEWVAGVSYAVGQRVRHLGELYRCLQAHVSQADWAPEAAPSLWARVLPGQEGSGTEVGEWEQPDSTNGYQLGDRVTHDGHLWESTFDGANVWEPGATGTESLWKDLGPVEGGDA